MGTKVASDCDKTRYNFPLVFTLFGYGKDPHIRVGGPEFGVKLAKSRILQYFETKSNRVTMKMDVSYTDHSHIIGKVKKNEYINVLYRDDE